MKIVKFVKHSLSCNQDYTGEYESCYSFDFILSELINFEVCGTRYVIDRIHMCNELYSDDYVIVFANEKTEFKGIEIPYNFLVMMYVRLNREERRGSLKGYIFSDDFMELLREMRSNRPSTTV